MSLRHVLSASTVIAMLAALVAISPTATAAPATCFGRTVTITAQPGQPVEGTSGPDVIMGTTGNDVINAKGGNDRICSRGGDDTVRGGPGKDRINLGSGDDRGWGGAGNDILRGRSGNDRLKGGGGQDVLVGNAGSDRLWGNRGPDVLRGGAGFDICRGGAGTDTLSSCNEQPAPVTTGFSDSFDGTGPLVGYTTNNASAVPNVARVDGRYRAEVSDNTNNKTLHFNNAQGRLDAKELTFPFDIAVRNIGIGRLNNSQTAPSAASNPYVFAGVQVHVTDLDDTNSSHVVVGHRGGTHFTIEGKNTRNGSSSVNDAGANVAPNGRADIRIVGNNDRTITVYWQTPNTGGADNWTLYNGTGTLPGTAPTYGPTVFVGLITYAFELNGLPFVGTADAIEDLSQVTY